MAGDHGMKMRILNNLRRAAQTARTPILSAFQDDDEMMAILKIAEQLEAATARAIGRAMDEITDEEKG